MFNLGMGGILGSLTVNDYLFVGQAKQNLKSAIKKPDSSHCEYDRVQSTSWYEPRISRRVVRRGGAEVFIMGMDIPVDFEDVKK